MSSNHLDIARGVLALEAEALTKLSEHIPKAFPEVVEKMLKSDGRVIVSGVGKSGHIGRKIAATLASTGTPSQFVHATEASHGDLGMLAENDFCLLISNSGETKELRDILAFTRRYSIPTAGISSVLTSSLMMAVDYKLCLPAVSEACAIGKAPTTSTTLTAALGDALAVSLMVARDFKMEQFRVFHPGGKLGVQLLKVADVMHGIRDVAVCDISQSVEEVVIEMIKFGFGLAVIMSEGSIEGVVSDGDLRRNAVGLMNKEVVEIMSKRPVSVAPDDLIETAIVNMEMFKTYTVLVREGNTPLGIIRMHDLLKAGIA